MCGSFVAPTIGAVTSGLFSSHASDTCAGGSSRSAAISRTTSTTSKSWSVYSSAAKMSLSALVVAGAPPLVRLPDSSPRASGLHGMMPMPWSTHSGIISRSSSR